ncbi:hypothetical protein [Nostoc sp. TCL26-01]|uniref:hypothetical protein n=1 Tax=Nostoc sp. TCL26-01 TaxID=2576904 RepID=UPI0015B7CCAC|nr:hypothetical protein [Nostoc sp. TCL26-01]QLE54330.1 hypothetical protein FD725_01540 [Nostoc sp. TCL26-01]
MVNGQWSMVNGQWSKLSTPFSTRGYANGNAKGEQHSALPHSLTQHSARAKRPASANSTQHSFTPLLSDAKTLNLALKLKYYGLSMMLLTMSMCFTG